MAEVRAAALGEGQAGDGGLRLRGLRRGDRRAPQDGDARRRASGGRRRPRPIPSTIGFHLSALYSPVGWLSWERIARAWEAAQGSDEAIRAFRNTILGETWVETGEAPDWRRLYDRRETLARGHGAEGRAVPDRRRRRAEGPHRGRRLGLGPRAGELARRSCRHRRRAGAPGEPGTRSRRCSGGHGCTRAGRSCRSPGSRSTPATRRRRSMPGRGGRGSRRSRRSRASRASTGRARCRARPTWTRPTAASASVAAPGSGPWRSRPSRPRPTASCGSTGRRRRSSRAGAAFPPGTVHLPDWVESEWLKQFVAEQLVTVKTKRGFARLEWQKLGSATRRWTAGSTPAPPPGSPAPTAGPRRAGPTWRRSSAPAGMMIAEGRMRPAVPARSGRSGRCCAGAACAPSYMG